LLDVLGLPREAVYPDVPFEDLIMIPALRGEYGPGDPAEQVAARRALAIKFEAHRFERARPSGRTHLVEGRPMKSGDRIIGFVTSYTDITDRKAAEIARSRFQEGIIQSNRVKSVRLDSKTDLVYQNLLSSVIENAQLAALEITYGVETGRIAEMLESVRNSTLRTAEVLEHLIWHASRTSGAKKPDR